MCSRAPERIAAQRSWRRTSGCRNTKKDFGVQIFLSGENSWWHQDTSPNSGRLVARAVPESTGFVNACILNCVAVAKTSPPPSWSSGTPSGTFGWSWSWFHHCRQWHVDVCWGQWSAPSLLWWRGKSMGLSMSITRLSLLSTGCKEEAEGESDHGQIQIMFLGAHYCHRCDYQGPFGLACTRSIQA